MQYKLSVTFADRKYEERSYAPKIRKWATPLKSYSRENATPSSGTSPLACYKEVPPGSHSVKKQR